MKQSDIRYEQLKEKDYNLAQDIDLGEDFMRILSDEPESLIAIFLENELVALAQVEKTVPQSYLSVFVAPVFRRQGIGSAIVKYVEDILQEGETKTIISSFHTNDNASLAFARNHGFNKYFSSAFMQRSGEPFTLEILPVRPYTDGDYIESQVLSATAFHDMRIRVGCFPDSVITKPSEKGREEWKEDARNHFVYEENGEIIAHGHLCGNELSSIAIRTDMQGRGIGKKFTMYLCNELYKRGNGTVELWCVVGNYARNLYDSLGFKEKYIAEFPCKILQ